MSMHMQTVLLRTRMVGLSLIIELVLVKMQTMLVNMQIVSINMQICVDEYANCAAVKDADCGFMG